MERQPLGDGPHAPVHEQRAKVDATQVLLGSFDARATHHTKLFGSSKRKRVSEHFLQMEKNASKRVVAHREDRQGSEWRSVHESVEEQLLIRCL